MEVGYIRKYIVTAKCKKTDDIGQFAI